MFVQDLTPRFVMLTPRFVMPKRGKGHFSFQDKEIADIKGAAIAKSLGGSCLPNLNSIFSKREELLRYVESLPSSIKTDDEYQLWFNFKNAFHNFMRAKSNEWPRRLHA